MVRSVLNEIIDNVVEQCEQLVTKETEYTESIETSIMKIKEKFNKITFFKAKNDIYFHANEVAKYLQYCNYCSAIYKIVNNEDKITFHHLKTILNTPSLADGVNFKPETYFINQDGLLDLIIKSRMLLALQFRIWLYREVIHSILNTGVYVSPQLIDQLSGKT